MEQAETLEAEYKHDGLDKRLAKRLVRIGRLLHTAPSLPFASLTPDEAEQKGFYRYLSHATLRPKDTHAPHRKQTCLRAFNDDTFLAIHDTTEMNFTLYPDQAPRTHLAKLSSKKQGFSCHTTLFCGMPPFCEPFGVFRFQPYVHETKVQDEAMRAWWQANGEVFENESRRWKDAIEETENAARAGQALHVMDRESDTYAMLVFLQQRGSRFVLRHRMDRKLEDGTWFEEAWENAEVRAEKEVRIHRRLRTHERPATDKTNYQRESRMVHLQLQSQTLRLKRAHDPPKGVRRDDWKDVSSSLVVHALHAKEVEVPEGAVGVEWYLLTSEPLQTEADCLAVLAIYEARWLIEELFKALKTGCGYEKRQEESAGTLLQMLALSWPQAWWLLRTRFLREQAPEAPASSLLEDWEEALLRAATPKYKWKRHATIRDLFGALAYLGGHYERKKPPGWAILGRGYQKFLAMCEAVSLYKRSLEA